MKVVTVRGKVTRNHTLHFSSTSSTMVPATTTTTTTNNNNRSSSNMARGSFILLEGIDRCGKTTQSGLLRNRLLAAGYAVAAMRFPDRTTATGQIIDSYLQSNQNLDDRAIHLLFSANRWESTTTLTQHLRQGTTVVCDRYAYSGVAFSAAKVNPTTCHPILSLEWCRAPDRGLPAPDCVIFLDLTQEEAEKRGGYGGERYEKRDMQIRVRQQFAKLQKLDEGRVPWRIINAAQSVKSVEQDIWDVVQETVEVCKEKPLRKMWEEGDYDMDDYLQQDASEKDD